MGMRMLLMNITIYLLCILSRISGLEATIACIILFYAVNKMQWNICHPLKILFSTHISMSLKIGIRMLEEWG